MLSFVYIPSLIDDNDDNIHGNYNNNKMNDLKTVLFRSVYKIYRKKTLSCAFVSSFKFCMTSVRQENSHYLWLQFPF